jgi:hypothetical protein
LIHVRGEPRHNSEQISHFRIIVYTLTSIHLQLWHHDFYRLKLHHLRTPAPPLPGWSLMLDTAFAAELHTIICHGKAKIKNSTVYNAKNVVTLFNQ